MGKHQDFTLSEVLLDCLIINCFLCLVGNKHHNYVGFFGHFCSFHDFQTGSYGIFPGLTAWLLNLLGSTYCQGSALTAREYGAALIGNLLLTWLARNAEVSVTRLAIIWNLFIYDAIALVVTLTIQLSGGLNVLGWGIVAVYLFFTLGFGWFLLPKAKIA